MPRHGESRGGDPARSPLPREAANRIRGLYEYLDRVLDAVPTPVFVKDEELRFRNVNPAFCRLMGRTYGELIGSASRELFPAAQAEGFEESDRRVLATGEAEEWEATIRPNGAARRVVVVRKAPSLDENGRPVVVGVVSDITQIREAHRARRLAEQVFQHSADAILVADDRNRVLAVNRSFEGVTGYREEEVLGRDAGLLFDEDADLPAPEAIWRHLREHGVWSGERPGRRKNGERFPGWFSISTLVGDDGAVLRHFAIFRDVTERKEAEERIRWLAQHDYLTGVANRTLLEERAVYVIGRAGRDGFKVAFVLVDLDRFKQVNDRLGHHVGDELLRQVARRMESVVRSTDLVARTGGDEFVLLLPDVRIEEDAARVARKVIDVLSRPFDIEGESVEVGASLGIALCPDDASDLDGLSRAADRAMYGVKGSGRNDFRFASAE